MKPIPISAAAQIAKQYGYDQVVIIARKVGEEPDEHGEHVTTYGVDPAHCGVAARIGDFLKYKIMGWPRDGETRAERDVLAERRRQIEAEGFTPGHDDEHTIGELGLAAALYLIPYEATIGGERLLKQDDFIGLQMALELSSNWKLKPEKDRRRRLVKGCALGLAEIERLDRAAEGAK